MIEHRRRIHRALTSSPSLKNCLVGVVDECYASAGKQARAETQLSLDWFPVNCLYTVPDILRDDFLPD